MKFRNDLEERCYNIAMDMLGDNVAIEHNKKIQIESALFPEVASFSGPPTKEIDVLTSEIYAEPKIVLLVSCKQLSGKSVPAHIQEWGAVVQTMNKYGEGSIFFGLIICPSGFTSGCESWATTHNLGILPPLKGRSLVFSEEAVLSMFKRVIASLKKRMQYSFTDLMSAPHFFDFVYSIVNDYEGHEEAAREGRYYEAPKGWLSSFSEMYSKTADNTVEDIGAVEDATILKLSNGIRLRFEKNRVYYGNTSELEEGVLVEPKCCKNIEMESCTFDFLKSTVIGKRITSAGDFGEYLEFGLDQRFNFGLHVDGFHIISTETPIEDHRL